MNQNKITGSKTDRDGTLVNICATEYDEHLDTHTINLTLRMQDAAMDAVKAVKAACREYVGTEDGKKMLESNCGCFDWADVADVPDEICRKHGFEIVNCYCHDLNVCLSEQLI